MLGHNIGKQDQYCAAFGGLNHFSFNSNGRVAIDPIVLNTEVEKVIFDYVEYQVIGELKAIKYYEKPKC